MGEMHRADDERERADTVPDPELALWVAIHAEFGERIDLARATTSRTREVVTSWGGDELPPVLRLAVIAGEAAPTSRAPVPPALLRRRVLGPAVPRSDDED